MLSKKQWEPDAVLMLGTALFSCLFIGMVVAGLLSHLLSDWADDDLKALHFVIGVFSFQGAVIVLVSVFLHYHGLSWPAAFGFKNKSWTRVTGYGLLTGLITVVVGLELGWICGELFMRLGLNPEPQQAVRIMQTTTVASRQVFYGVVAIGLAPVAEELLFRGLLYPTLKQAGYPRMALWGSAILFALIHMNLLALIPLTFVALMLTWLYEETDNLIAPIIAHSLFNAANFVLLTHERWVHWLGRWLYERI